MNSRLLGLQSRALGQTWRRARHHLGHRCTRISQIDRKDRHSVQISYLCLSCSLWLILGRRERFELSKRVWKTRMFPATSSPRFSSSDLGAPGGIRTHNLDVRSVAPIQLSFGSSLLPTAPASCLLLLVREDRIELSPRVSRTRMLALHHARKRSQNRNAVASGPVN